ncbi:MAG TPA: SpoIIE family protein phosphatase [Solirubrobacterales bacterium]|jgi:serine phosphatase RsbU (regulator of sigma subunit)/ketosteroid isomerase-like protein|nr:SpoIIE family protein phosphatase [Solirubrobacterales bacterium]
MASVAIAVLVAALVLALVLLAAFAVRARRTERRLAVLDQVADSAETGHSLEETLTAITDMLVPELADLCTIDLIEEGRVRRAAVRAHGPRAAEIEAGIRARQPVLQARMADAAAREKQQPRFFERVSVTDMREVASDQADLDFLLSTEIHSSVTVELRTRGEATGMLSLGIIHRRRGFGPEDAHFVSTLAGRIALALDNAGLFSELKRRDHERSEIAETLQRGLLPPPLPHIPSWSLAATYRPAGAENELGGDFYDAFRISGGWMVVVGDVTGRGAQAAAVTAHARYTLRTAAALTGDPVVALRTLNRELLTRRGAALCSVAAMAIDEGDARSLRLAVAGHPPPLIAGARGAREAAPAGPVLGAFPDASWRVGHAELGQGEVLVVITDGVTDARGDSERFGEPRLRRELQGVAGVAPATQRLEIALQSFSPGNQEDDAAILAIAPAPSALPLAVAAERELVERLFAAFNRRDGEEIVELCDERMEFFATGTAEAIGRDAPYMGPSGLQQYLRDVERAWDELLITPSVVESRNGNGGVMVFGRVYARSRLLGIRDIPVAWAWELRGERFVRGEVFPDPDQAPR